MSAVVREKRIPKPPRKCIFCGGTPISREHVFARWMHPYLPVRSDLKMRGQLITIGEISPDGTLTYGQPTEGPLDSHGGPPAKKLKVACAPCNNGWMSELQNDAKPALLPFITGAWPALAIPEQRLIAAWVAMFTMVLEKSYEPIETITYVQRKAFKERGKARCPPKNWLIWWTRTVGANLPQGASAVSKPIYDSQHSIGLALSWFPPHATRFFRQPAVI